ncbi:hypothetical protein [Allosphingosinicella deserti]|nr:hypothetical protein [Sphingomonas deserti]
MTATRIVELDDGSSVLETLDFRSEFSFEDFAEWITAALRVQPKSGVIVADMQPFTFDWEGSTFDAAWSDDHGCFVKAPFGQTAQLRALQSALAA